MRIPYMWRVKSRKLDRIGRGFRLALSTSRRTDNMRDLEMRTRKGDKLWLS